MSMAGSFHGHRCRIKNGDCVCFLSLFCFLSTFFMPDEAAQWPLYSKIYFLTRVLPYTPKLPSPLDRQGIGHLWGTGEWGTVLTTSPLGTKKWFPSPMAPEPQKGSPVHPRNIQAKVSVLPRIASPWFSCWVSGLLILSLSLSLVMVSILTKRKKGFNLFLFLCITLTE